MIRLFRKSLISLMIFTMLFTPAALAGEIVITRDLGPVDVSMGETVTVEIEAEGEGLRYEWYRRNSLEGIEMKLDESVTGSSYTLTVDDPYIELACNIIDADGHIAYSDIARLSDYAPVIEITPEESGDEQDASVSATLHSSADAFVPSSPEEEAPFLGKWLLTSVSHGGEISEANVYTLLLLEPGGAAFIDHGNVMSETNWKAEADGVLIDDSSLRFAEDSLRVRQGTNLYIFERYEGEPLMRRATPEEVFGCWTVVGGRDTFRVFSGGSASSEYPEGAYAVHLWTEEDDALLLLWGTHRPTGVYLNPEGGLSLKGTLYERTEPAGEYLTGEPFTAEEIEYLQAFWMGLAAAETTLPEGADLCPNVDALMKLILAQE